MTNRKGVTNLLSKLLILQRLNKDSVFWSSEVTVDWGTKFTKRVDFMQFKPANQFVSGIEKGDFICYEVKSCKDDFHSGNGLNFIGDKNYIVTTMDCYKQIVNEIPYNVGVLVAVPFLADTYEEFEKPTPLPEVSDNNSENNKIFQEWELRIIKNAHPANRRYATSELLFCMLRSGK